MNIFVSYLKFGSGERGLSLLQVVTLNRQHIKQRLERRFRLLRKPNKLQDFIGFKTLATCEILRSILDFTHTLQVCILDRLEESVVLLAEQQILLRFFNAHSDEGTPQ